MSPHAQMRPQPAILKNEPKSRRLSVALVADAPRIGPQQAGQEPKQRRFSRAAGPKQAQHARTPMFKVDSTQNLLRAVGKSKIFHLQCAHVLFLSCRPTRHSSATTTATTSTMISKSHASAATM